MGTVYLADDPDAGREVVIKVLRPEYRQEAAFLARFRREARAIAKLEHPAIVTVYEFGAEEQQPYLVMRYMKGGSLAERIHWGQVTLEQAAKLFERIGEALDYAHEEGMIHRDVKPGNILFDQRGAPYLSDFGLVKLVEPDGSSLTTSHAGMGTPEYMSPEQARGEDDLDSRTDIYALGVMFFQILTNRLPYKASTPTGTAWKQANDPIPDIRPLRPDLPATSQQVIEKALAKGRDERYQSGQELAEAIAGLVRQMNQPSPPGTVALEPADGPKAKSEKYFGRYEIITELGQGGMGHVYYARDIQPSQDPSYSGEVAIKVLAPKWRDDPTFRARFKREASTIAVLNHPAIVPVHNYGEEDGQPYLVMAYMAGGSLADRLGQGPLPVAEAIAIGQQICAALNYVHRKGVVHRDLKPHNILFDEHGNPHISDFGLLKLIQADVTRLTPDKNVMGTWPYMSPEQWTTDDVDGRADIYAMGVIFFRMLTGRLPYTSETPERLLSQHLNDPIPRLNDSRPGLPAAYQQVIDRAMAKNRDDRYRTGAEMGAALAALNAKGLDGGVVVPEPPAPPTTYLPKATRRAARDLPVWFYVVGFLVSVCIMVGTLLAASGGGLLIWGNGEVDTATPEPTSTVVVVVTEPPATRAMNTLTPTGTRTPTATSSHNPSATNTLEATPTAIVSRPASPTAAATRTPTRAATATRTATRPATPTVVPQPSATQPLPPTDEPPTQPTFTPSFTPEIPTDTPAPPEPATDTPAPP